MKTKYYEYTCACGCNGQLEIKEIHKYNGIPIYILGHNWRNKKRGNRSKEYRQKLSIGNKGKKRTEKFKQNISKNFSGENHPMYGKHHTKEAVQKISESGKKLKRIPWNKNKTGVYSEETLELFSIITTKRILQNNGKSIGHKGLKKGFFYSNKNNKELWYSSSYELKAYKILEDSVFAKNYDRCHFSIPYIFENKNKRYIPDILVEYITGIKEIIEIKPKQLLHIDKNPSKFKVLKEYSKKQKVKYSIWTEQELNLISQ